MLTISRRGFLASLPAVAAVLARAADSPLAGPNLRWAVSSGLWRHIPGCTFADILSVMQDTGFTGIRLVDFPGSLQHYGLTEAKLGRELSRRDLHLATISWHGRLWDPAARADDLASARRAMKFLGDLGANHLVVFPPPRKIPHADSPATFREVCDRCNRIGELAGEMGFTAGLHNHMDMFIQTQDEIDRFMAGTDPRLFGLSPDTAHLDLAGCDVVGTLRRYRRRIHFLDYKDARWTTPAQDWVGPDGVTYARDSGSAKFYNSIYDLGDGEVDFPGCHRVLKQAHYRGWICVDLDTARHGPLASYRRCRDYIAKNLDPIYR